VYSRAIKVEELLLINKWILSRFNNAVKDVNTAFDGYDFGNATIAF